MIQCRLYHNKYSMHSMSRLALMLYKVSVKSSHRPFWKQYRFMAKSTLNSTSKNLSKEAVNSKDKKFTNVLYAFWPQPCRNHCIKTNTEMVEVQFLWRVLFLHLLASLNLVKCLILWQTKNKESPLHRTVIWKTFV